MPVVADFDLGDVIHLIKDDIITTIIGIHKAVGPNIIGGWINKPCGFGWDINDRAGFYSCIKNIDTYNYGWYFATNEPCILIEKYEKIIQNEKQICIGCNKSAPHIKSNLPDDKYICSICKVLLDL